MTLNHKVSSSIPFAAIDSHPVLVTNVIVQLQFVLPFS